MRPYKITGRGDVRDVYDGERLVGHIHRYTYNGGSGTLCFDKGRVVSATYRMRKKTAWRATWPNGEPVVRGGPRGGDRLFRDTIKGWRDPSWWSLAKPPTTDLETP